MADKNKDSAIVFDRDLNPNTKEFKRKKKKPKSKATDEAKTTEQNAENSNVNTSSQLDKTKSKQISEVSQLKDQNEKSNTNTEGDNKEKKSMKSTSKSKKKAKAENSEEDQNNKMDKTVKKGLDSQELSSINPNNSTSNNNITQQPTVIYDVQEAKPRVDLSNGNKVIKKRKNTKISFTYKRENFTLDLKQKTTVEELRKLIADQVYLLSSDIDIFYKGKPLTNEQDSQRVFFLLKDDNAPYFEIKKKSMYNSLENVSQLYPKVYKNKVIVDGIKDAMDLNSKIEQFFKDCCIEKDCYCEPLSETKYSIGFTYPDLAFDFNRFLLILKGTNELYSNTKSNLQLGKNTGRKNRMKIDTSIEGKYEMRGIGGMFSNSKRGEKYSSLYVGLSGPYMSQETRERKEYLESKKKWINKQGFIPYVRKNPNWYNNKFMF